LTGNNADTVKVCIMQVAAFRKGKDQKTVIRALQHLPGDFHLFFVGDGEYRLECEQLSIELGLASRVHFLGQRMDVPELIKGADILVLSTEFEGLSLASIEAMASGNPFIASDVPGVTGLVKDYGILFPLGDERRLAAEIMHLSTDPEYKREVIRKCIERAGDFDIKNMIHEHITLYEELV